MLLDKLLFQAGLSASVFAANENIKVSSFKSSKKNQKKEGGPDRSVSNDKLSSVILIELTIKARENML